MHVDWSYGPDAEPFALDDCGVPSSATGMPFHGIPGRGMAELMVRDGVPPGVWERHAHRIFAPPELDDGLLALRTLATECGALSFADSCATVLVYLECQGVAGSAEVWHLKEGHTSSVWKVTTADEEFVLNVARDRAASDELRRTSIRMMELQGHAGVTMADVIDVGPVAPADVFVARNEWIHDALEVHQERDPRRPYLLVERFLTADDAPARIVSIYGRRCTQDEQRRIDEDLARFREVTGASLDLGHGDVVWNGCEAIVVAIS